MNRPLKHMNAGHPSLSTAMRLAAANSGRLAKPAGALPQRPNLTVLNAAIPLFFIGKNRRGL
jgi:hypothetical protein